MKIKTLLPLILLLASCQGNNLPSSTSKISSSSNFISSSEEISSSSFISSSSSASSSVTINYQEDSLDNYDFNYDDLSDTYSIKFYKKFMKNLRLPSMYNGKMVVGIDDNAFNSAGGVENVLIPNTYTSIDGMSFKGLLTLKSIKIDEGSSNFTSINNALYSKDGLSLICAPLGIRDYVVSEGTKYIANNAFNGGIRMKSVVLPESVIEIGEYAFNACKTLTKINIPSKVERINRRTFSECFDLAAIEGMENVKTIGEYAFYQCHALGDFKIPDNVEFIEKGAFYACNKMYNLTFGKSVKIIGEQSFAYCEMLESITFSESIREIGNYAFIQNFALQELVIPEGVESLADGAFYYFTSLRKVSLPSTLEYIGFDAFASSYPTIKEFVINESSNFYTVYNGAIYTKDYKKIIFHAPHYDSAEHIMHEDCEEISSHAFYGSERLKNITLSKSLKKIGMVPFFLCKSIETVSYPNTISEFENVEKEVFIEPTMEENVYTYYYWNNTYGRNIRKVICSDGEYECGVAQETIVENQE